MNSTSAANVALVDGDDRAREAAELRHAGEARPGERVPRLERESHRVGPKVGPT